MFDNLTVMILAAGQGKRMQSDKAKVLHEINGRPMLHYVMDTARAIAGDNVVVVVGHQHKIVREAALKNGQARFALQHRQNGTGDAVMVGMAALPDNVQRVVILCGDVPLISAATLTAFVENHLSQKAQVSVLGVHQENPHGYGRIVQDEAGELLGIVEEADADAEQKSINFVNSGIYCVEAGVLYSTLPLIENNNAQNEVYLTDIVAVARDMGYKTTAYLGQNAQEVLGVNTVQELERVAGLLK